MIKDLITLIRVPNSFLVGFAVIVGIVLASPKMFFSLASVLGFLTGFFISAYSMVLNDRYDIEVDRINKPSRPLPSGRVSVSTAITYAFVLLIIGLLMALLTSIPNLIIAICFALLAWFYSYWGKKKGLVGNVMVAASVSIPYLYGGFAVGVHLYPLVIFLTITSFLAAWGREVIKTISDIAGDEVRNVRSVARLYGEGVAARLGATLFLAAVLSTVLPLVANVVGLVFAIAIIVPDAIFIHASLSILKEPSASNAIRVKMMSLVGMAIGLLAFIVGGVFRG